MKLTQSTMRKMILQEMRLLLEEPGQETSFDIDTHGSPVTTAIKFVSMDTPYDQTITKLQIKPDGEDFEDVEFYGSTADDLADDIISYLEPETSENFIYWFLEDGSDEDLLEEFKSLVVTALEDLNIDPSEYASDRTLYRDKDTGGTY